MASFRFASPRSRPAVFGVLAVFSSVCCVLVLLSSHEDILEASVFPLSVDYYGAAVSLLYQRGFDVSPRTCQVGKRRVEVLVVVYSTCRDIAARNSVRRTWKAHSRPGDVSVVFLVGRSSNLSCTHGLRAESRTHGDLIVSRNFDSGAKLTLKSVAMVEWVSDHCPRVRRVVRTDHDVLLNVPRLLEVVRSTRGDRRTVYGHLLRGTRPVRTPGDECWVPRSEYPADRYPDHVLGRAYMFTGDLARLQFSAALKMRFFRMEEVFFTGFLAERLGARLAHVDGFFAALDDVGRVNASDDREWAFDPCDLRRRVAVQHGGQDAMYQLWRVFNDRSRNC
ncbi:beta-1,3-galactosyltransferase 5-like [Bacillus rossius redtenbacheri]|uniref:beta-1,3-galactosyltransferase 5-like n=1 Tax=Bacillus rossius redtenbacheri TaxID=93214 RepID=UPI002FDCF565